MVANTKLVDGSRKPPETVEEIASEYVRELRQLRPRGPYLLSGYSLGAVLAFEPSYEKLGSRAAEAATRLLEDKADTVLPPDEFVVWVNLTTASKLNVQINYDPDDVTVKEYRR